MATKTKAGADGRALQPAGCESRIDPDIEVGVLADGTIRFWCFAKFGRAYRLSLREGRKGQKPVYTETDEWFATGTEAEAECWERNRKAVRRA